MSEADDRNAEPSGYRVSQARDMGHIPLATALVKALTLAFSLMLVAMRGPALLRSFVALVRGTLQSLPQIASGGITAKPLQNMVIENLLKIFEPLMVVMAGIMASFLVIHQLTSGGSWTPALALPQPSRLMKFWSKFDDESGGSRPPLTHRIIIGLAKPLAAGTGCLGVLMAIRWQWFSTSMVNGDWSVAVLRGEILKARFIIGKSLFMLTIPMILLGLLEMYINRLHWYERLRPSTDQARRELKELEGDPELKNRRKRLAQQIRESGRVEQLVMDTEAVIVGTSMTGLCIQIVRQTNGKLFVGQVLRGSLSARFAEKAAAQGKPWKRDTKLARILVDLAAGGHRVPVELPLALSTTIQSVIVNQKQKQRQKRHSA